jgi:xylitol oxidase
MSPAFQQPIVGIHFTWKKDWPAVSALLPVIDEKLKPMKARPHWAKLFTMPAEVVQSHYAKLADFRRLAASLDPQGKFRNAFLDRCIL